MLYKNEIKLISSNITVAEQHYEWMKIVIAAAILFYCAENNENFKFSQKKINFLLCAAFVWLVK